MFGFLVRSQESIEASPTSFERLIGDAAGLREAIWERVAGLSFRDKVTFFCVIRDLSSAIRKAHSTPLETLPFGPLPALTSQQSKVLIREIGKFFTEADRDGNELAALAAAYCQAMAIVCLAGSVAKGQQQQLRFTSLRDEFARQTEELIESLEYA